LLCAQHGFAFERRIYFALNTASPLSALVFFDAAWLRRPCLDRFAVFAKASRI